jgi:hypothetical protein
VLDEILGDYDFANTPIFVGLIAYLTAAAPIYLFASSMIRIRDAG